MELRCPDCCSPEVGFAPDGAEERRCANCGACFASEAALVTVADARGTAEPPRFSLAAERAAAELEGLGGALAPVNPYSDADELNGLLDDALATGIIAVTMPGPAESSSARLYVYPMSLSDPSRPSRSTPAAARPARPAAAPARGGGRGPRLRHPPPPGRGGRGGEPPRRPGQRRGRLPGSHRLLPQPPGPWNGGDVCEYVTREPRAAAANYVGVTPAWEPVPPIAGALRAQAEGTGSHSVWVPRARRTR